MKENNKELSIRWIYLVIGVVALLFAGIVYGWSILKAPLRDEFGWENSALALNFTVTMSFFCLGGIVGGLLKPRVGSKLTLVLAAVFSSLGFIFASKLSGKSIVMLYITYGAMAGLGIGIAYNIIISVVNAWFPDKKGTCSGALMMGFGASALIMGSVAGSLISNPNVGWRSTYVVLGACLGIVLVLAGFILKEPSSDVKLPEQPKRKNQIEDDSVGRDYTPSEMLHNFTFWRVFLCIMLLASLGTSVISFAMDFSLSLGVSAALATSLVGVLSICNGLGRIAIGAIFDKFGRKKTLFLANGLAIFAALSLMLAVMTHSTILGILGLCVTGFAYGACPTLSTALVAEFYGRKNFSINFSIINLNLMPASFMATVSGILLSNSGSFLAPFTFLLVLTLVALGLNISIKHP
jgi:OFA family oxalate/formate antiporter-like MFS transporter